MVVIPYLVQCQGNALLKHPLTLKILTLSISVYCILLSLNLFIHSIQCITPEATGSFIQEMAQCYATDFRDIEIVNTLSFYLFILLMHNSVFIPFYPFFFLPFYCIILRPYLFIRWFNVTPMHYSLVQF